MFSGYLCKIPQICMNLDLSGCPVIRRARSINLSIVLYVLKTVRWLVQTVESNGPKMYSCGTVRGTREEKCLFSID